MFAIKKLCILAICMGISTSKTFGAELTQQIQPGQPDAHRQLEAQTFGLIASLLNLGHTTTTTTDCDKSAAGTVTANTNVSGKTSTGVSGSVGVSGSLSGGVSGNAGTSTSTSTLSASSAGSTSSVKQYLRQ